MKPREEIMSDEDRIAAWKAAGKRCVYCRGERAIATITDRLFGCCHECAERDNKEFPISSVRCICCDKELTVSCGNEKFTINTVDHESFNDGAAASIWCGYGSRFDGKRFIIAICDDCIEKSITGG